MKLMVFGASGQTGREIVKQALEQGYEVVAFVRVSKKLTLTHERMSVVQGDVLDLSSVEKAIQGVDAVLVALGTKPDTKPTMQTEGTANIVSAMEKFGVKRLIVEGSYPMSGSVEGVAFLKTAGTDDNTLKTLQPMINDKAGQEKVVRESGLEWVIVRPLSLTNGPKTGTYRSSETLSVKPGDTISRADVADFMLKQLASSEWLGRIVTISY